MRPLPRSPRGLILLAAATSAAYLLYRGLFTLNLVTSYATFASLLLYGCEVFSVSMFWLYLFQVWDPREPDRPKVLHGRSVDVLIPTLNEDVGLLRQTLEAASRMHYPHAVYLLDDGKRLEVRQLAESLGAIYLTRDDLRGAKAGSLNDALSRSEGEFVVVLDADHVPEPHFLSRLIGHFRDDKVGFVQTPHSFYNFDAFQAHVGGDGRYWDESGLFYRVVQPGRNRWDSAICAGSAVIFRRAALEDVGGFAVETVTEDIHTGLRIHAKGWHSVAVGERLVAGQAAPDVTTFHSQRLRWGEGNLAMLKHDNPMWMKGLNWKQRLCYVGSVFHWLTGFAKLGIYLSPILMLFTGVPPVSGFSWGLLSFTLLYLLITFTALKVTGRGYASVLHSELFGMISFATQIRSAFRALFGIGGNKFVVTSKRGPQSKRVWPLVLPQVTLGVLGVLALVWGWSHVAFGISLDWYRPLFATIWVVLHVGLAAWAVRRAYRQTDRRYATRHGTNLPMEYEPTDDPAARRRSAVTVDLAEGGIGFVAYELMPRGTRLRLSIHGPDGPVDCIAEVCSLTGLDDESVGSRGYRYGATLHNLNPRQVDNLSRIALHYAVPRWHSEFESHLGDTPLSRFRNWRSREGRQRRGTRRFPYRLPASIDLGDARDEPLRSTTEDISREAFTCVLTTELTPGTMVPYRLQSPLGEIRGRAEVVRCDPKPFAGRPFFRCVFRFGHFYGHGRTLVMMLGNAKAMAKSLPILSPKPKPRTSPATRPLMIAAGLALPLALLILIPFRAVHSDDLFLRGVADQRGEVTPAQRDRLDGIADRTLAEGYPSTDRLALLMAALGNANRGTLMDEVALRLAPRDRDNLPLRTAFAHALDRSREHLLAEAEFERAAELARERGIDPREIADLQLNAARAAARAGRFDYASKHFDAILAERPNDHGVRDEYAGVLLDAGQAEQLPNLYRGTEPTREGRGLLIAAYTRMREFGRAESEAQELARLFPRDRDVERTLADIALARKGYDRAAEAYRRLAERDPYDRGILVRLGQAANGAGRYAEALGVFGRLIRGGDTSLEAAEGFIDSAAGAGAERLAPGDRNAAERVANSPVTGELDAVRLTRLAGVLAGLGLAGPAADLAILAVRKEPNDDALRSEAVGVLASAGRSDAALSLLGPDRNDPRAWRSRIDIHLCDRDFPSAEAAARRYLDREPGDEQVRLLLSDLIGWQGRHEEAEEALEGVRTPEASERLARLALWREDYPLALTRYEGLLASHFERPDLWPGFIDAASGERSLTPAQLGIAERIAERGPSSGEPLTAQSLSRLAWVLLRDGRDEGAGRALDRALLLTPESAEVRSELAGSLARAGRYEESSRLLKRAGGLDADSRMRLARTLAAAGHFDAAFGQAQLALQADPARREARHLIAEVAERSGDHERSLVLWRELQAQHPLDEEPRLRAAETLLAWAREEPRMIGDAVREYDSLLKGDGDRLRVWRGWAQAADLAGRLETPAQLTALSIASAVLNAGVTDAPLIAALSRVLSRGDSDRLAAELLDSALTVPPAEDWQRRELADALAEAGRFEDVLSLYHGVKLDSSGHAFLADVAAGAGRFDLAAKHALHASRKDPDNVTALRKLAAALTWAGDYERALEVAVPLAEADHEDGPLTTVVARSPRFTGPDAGLEASRVWLHLIDATAGLSGYGDVPLSLLRRAYGRLSVSEFIDPLRFARLAVALQERGDLDRARALSDKALMVIPRDPSQRRELADILVRLGRPKSAAGVLTHTGLFELTPANASNVTARLDRLGEIEGRARGDLEAAPDDPATQERLADILAWRGNFLEANQLYLRARGRSEKWAWSVIWAGRPLLAVEHLAGLGRLTAEQAEAFVEAALRVAPGKLTRDHRLALRRLGSNPDRFNGGDAALLCKLGYALALADDRRMSENAFRMALRKNPGSRMVRLQLAHAYAVMGLRDEAVRQLQSVKAE